MADRLDVIEAEQNLHWTEAMFAGDRKGAAIAKRDGAKAKLALMAEKIEAGVLDPAKTAPIEHELAEAEVLLSELESVQPSVQQPGAGTPAAAQNLSFGPVTNGLQAAVELTTSNGVLRLGEPIEVTFHIRNSSGERVFLTGASWRQDDDLTVEDQQGQKVEVHHIPQLGATPVKSEYLLPGWIAVFHGASLAFLPEDVDEKQVPLSVSYYVKVKPGRYTVSYRLDFREDRSTHVGPSDWQGELETAPVTVDVKAPATPAAVEATTPK
jgi:hypothetical protein